MPDLRGLPEQLDENPDLRPQNLGLDRRQDVVHRSERVTARRVRFVAVGRDEDNRGVLGALPLAHHRRGLEAVHAGHVDVEENDRELLPQELAKSFASGLRGDDVLAKLGKKSREREQLLGAVVDRQDVDLFVGEGHRVFRGDRPRFSQLRRWASAATENRCLPHLLVEPGPQHGQQLVGVDGLREVVPRSGLERLLPIPLHCLRGDRDDRQ